MTTKCKLLPAKVGTVLLILALAAALLSGSALASLSPSDVYVTVTQGVNSYVLLASYYEYSVYWSELGTGAYPPGMEVLEYEDTVALTGAPTQAGTYTGTGTVFYGSNDGGPDEQAEFTFTIIVEASATPTPEPTAAPTAAPVTVTVSATAPPAEPTAAPASVPKVTKSPTGETVSEGDMLLLLGAIVFFLLRSRRINQAARTERAAFRPESKSHEPDGIGDEREYERRYCQQEVSRRQDGGYGRGRACG